MLLTALRDAVRSGRLAPGTMLPPSRTLATDLGLARNTVAEAYAELVAEGWLASRQGAGTWVVNVGGSGAPAAPRGVRGVPTHNLMPGSPDVSEFPRTDVGGRHPPSAVERTHRGAADGRCARPPRTSRCARRIPDQGPRRAHIAGVDRGVRRRSPRGRTVGAGLRGRGPIAVEAYGLFIFRDALAALDVPTVPIGVDEHGAVIDELDGLDTPAVLLTPAHHSPFGMPLHPTRRTAVVEWARRTGGYVFDDDYDGEFRYDRQPVGALQALCPDRVVYMGSASKSLSQALRLGWMVLPDSLIDEVLDAAGGQQYYVDSLAQLTMADFIDSGRYDKHIRRMRMRYRKRRDTLVDALSGFDVGISGLSAGVNLVLTLPNDTEHEVVRRAGEAGIALQGLGIMRHPLAGPTVPDPDGIIVGFAAPAEHAFGPAVDALLSVLTASGLAR